MDAIKEAQPSDVEITQITLDKAVADQLLKLIDAEEGTMRSLKDLADKFDRSAKERKVFNDHQFEISRNYIQLVQRSSTIFQSKNLQKSKKILNIMKIPLMRSWN